MSKQKSYREQIIEVIESGSSHFVGNVQYTSANIGDLPSEAELSAGNPEAEASAVAGLDAEMARLASERDRLTKRMATAAKAPVKTEESEPTSNDMNRQMHDEADSNNPAAKEEFKVKEEFKAKK